MLPLMKFDHIWVVTEAELITDLKKKCPSFTLQQLPLIGDGDIFDIRDKIDLNHAL